MRYLVLVLCICLVRSPLLAFENPIEPPTSKGTCDSFHTWVEETPQRPIPKHQKRTLVLSIDGGGIRGVIPALLLDHLEKKLSEELNADIHIADFFDIMAGTSTGSIIALGLATPEEGHCYQPKYPAETLVQLYRDKGEEIFPETRWWHSSFWTSVVATKYSPMVLEEILMEQLETRYLTSGLQNTHLLIPALNLTDGEEFIFDSYHVQEEIHRYHKNDNDNAEKAYPLNYQMRHVARASSAAPTYFPAMKIHGKHYIDGGVFMNNPGLLACIRSQEIYPNTSVTMISLGTGQRRTLPWDAQKLSDAGWGRWGPNFPTVTMKVTGSSDENMLKRLISTNRTTDAPSQYYRLQAELVEDPLDDARPEAMEELIRAAEALLKSAEFEEIYQILKNCFIERNHPLKERIQDLDMKQSTHLNLQHLWFANPDWKILSDALNTTQHLTHITLRRCGISAERIQPICEGLAQHKNLTYLDLSENDIGRGIRTIGRLLGAHNSLKYLSVEYNSISSEHSESLLSLVETLKGTSTSLKALSLNGNPLETKGIYSLFSTLTTLFRPETGLSVLLLESVGLTIDTGIQGKLWKQQFDVLVEALPKDGFCSLYGNNIDRELKSTLHKQHAPTLNFYKSFTLKENLS